jgi:hypothetical protein
MLGEGMTREGARHDATRVDMHCHSTASQHSRLGVQRAVGLPECATPPREVYELAKRRGMDFLTITDHDTIAGVLLVNPARDLHPVGERSPEMVGWLSERRRYGDAIAQHGFQHVASRRGVSPREHAAIAAASSSDSTARRPGARCMRAGAFSSSPGSSPMAS